MRLILECDGVVLDVQPAYWAAYSAVCREKGMPRLDPAAFWRGIRRRAPDGQLVPGARPAALRAFRGQFDERLESDEMLGRLAPLAEVKPALARLAESGECFLVSTGPNRAARQQAMDRHDLSIHFMRMKALSDNRGYRVDQLRVLAENDPRTVVAAAGDGLILTAEEAGLFAVGVASGPCTAARLTRAGARCTFASLSELADSIAAGGDELVAAGWTPADRPRW